MIAKLSANLNIGQTVSITTSSVTLEMTKIHSFNLSSLFEIDQSEFYVPSFCSMKNQINNYFQNQIIIIIVNF